MIDSLISPLRPKLDQTLMSFLREAQVDAGYSEHGFLAVVAGAAMPNSRLAERRGFDWDSLSRYFNASPSELFAMSERSLYYNIAESNRSALLVQHAPWIQSAGYGAHCPCCIREEAYWRKSWLLPDACVCAEHGAVLVRHCFSCGGDLGEMNWIKPVPVCPTCAAHLSFSPTIQAPLGLSRRANIMRREVQDLFKNRPISWVAPGFARAAMVWRAAQVLNSKPQFVNMCANFCATFDFGMYDLQRTVEGRALRYAQSNVISHYLAEINPDLVEHYWLATDKSAQRGVEGKTVLLELSELAESFYL
jgi:hypothetical protein